MIIQKWSEVNKRVKATVFVSTKKPKTTEVIFSRLEKQNPGLSTKNWLVYTRQEMPSQSGFLLVLGVDDDTIQVLKTLDFRPHFELTRLPFRVHESAQGGGKVTSN